MKAAPVPLVPRPRALSVEGREALWLTAGGVSAIVAFCAYYLTNTVVMNEATPELLVEFQGHRPYQLRVLLPVILHVTTHWLSLPLVATTMLLITAFSLGLFFAFRAYIAHFSTPRAARWLSLGIIPALAICYSHRWFYLYDIPAVFFATLGLLLIAQKNWAIYLGMFAVATVNRESSSLLVLAYVLTMHKSLERNRFVLLLTTQVTIWLAIRVLIGWLLAGNPGSPVESQVEGNLAMIRDALFNSYVEKGFVVTMLFGVALWIVSSLTSAYTPEFLRLTRWIVLPFMGLMSLVGVLVETRIYGEMIPFLLPPP